MGGLIRVPKPVPAAVAAAPVVPVPAPVPPPETVAAAARGASREMARRGLAGTVATSARGALDMASLPTAGRKSLLGE